jgi:hypothetical protein
MKSNKVPGLDGLTVEFYREFWGKVNFFLIDVLNKSYDEKVLSFSQQTSVYPGELYRLLGASSF